MQIEDKETFPCGCIIGSSKGKFIIQPCSFNCPVYLETIRLSKERENTISYRYGEVE